MGGKTTKRKQKEPEEKRDSPDKQALRGKRRRISNTLDKSPKRSYRTEPSPRTGVLGLPITEKSTAPPNTPVESFKIDHPSELPQHLRPGTEGRLLIESDQHSEAEIVTFQPTANLGSRDWPKIRFAKDGPGPRWTLQKSKQDIRIDKDLSKDLIRTHKNRTNIIGVNKAAHPRSGDPKIGLGTLEWKFEPGPPAEWKGLTEEQLYEYAYVTLMDALGDYKSREIFRLAIRRNWFDPVRNVEDPLPPPPPPLAVTHFGPNAGTAEWPKVPPPVHQVSTRFFDGFERPSMALPDPRYPSLYVNRDHFLTSRMFHHLKETLDRETKKISHSRDPREDVSPVESVVSDDSETGKSPLSKEWDPEKATEAPRKPSPLRAGGAVMMKSY